MNDVFFMRRTVSGKQAQKRVSKSTLLVLEEAERQGVAWKKIPYTELFALTFEDETKYFHGQTPSETTEFAFHCCRNKEISKNILEGAGLSVSEGYVVKPTDTPTYRARVFASLPKPLIVKPIGDSQGKNVFVNITSFPELTESMDKIYASNGDQKSDLLIEHMFDGKEYRILATQEKILSVIERIPANVTGDGISTILELIEKKNADPIRVEMPTYKQIPVNDEVVEFLRHQSLTVESVLPEDKRVFLLPHGPLDITHGGDTVDVTDQIHPSVRTIIQQAMESFPGLSLSGIDFMTKDIRAEQTPDSYTIIEMNSSPSLDWNEFPLVGPHRQVTLEFLKIMFPGL